MLRQWVTAVKYSTTLTLMAGLSLFTLCGAEDLMLVGSCHLRDEFL